MGLMLDKEQSVRLKDRLNEFSKFGMTFYYLYEENKIDINDLINVYFSSDDEKSGFMYSKIISRLHQIDLEESFDKYKSEFPDIDQNNLNIIYTEKLINELGRNSSIDRLYVNTYNYLLEDYK